MKLKRRKEGRKEGKKDGGREGGRVGVRGREGSLEGKGREVKEREEKKGRESSRHPGVPIQGFHGGPEAISPKK